jgi:hypothetical protein
MKRCGLGFGVLPDLGCIGYNLGNQQRFLRVFAFTSVSFFPQGFNQGIIDCRAVIRQPVPPGFLISEGQ